MAYWVGIDWDKLERECPINISNIVQLVRPVSYKIKNINKRGVESLKKISEAKTKIEVALKEIFSWYYDESFLETEYDKLIKNIMNECIGIFSARLDRFTEEFKGFKDDDITYFRLISYAGEIESVLYGEIHNAIRDATLITKDKDEKERKKAFLLVLFRIHANHYISFYSPSRELKAGAKGGGGMRTYIPTLQELFEGKGKQQLENFYNKEILGRKIKEMMPYEEFIKTHGLMSEWKKWKESGMRLEPEEMEDEKEEEEEDEF